MREFLVNHRWARVSSLAFALGVAGLGIHEVANSEAPRSSTVYETSVGLNDLVAELPPQCDETVQQGLVEDGELNIFGNPACDSATLGQANEVAAAHADLQTALSDSEPAWHDAAGGTAAVAGVGTAVWLLGLGRRHI